MNCEFSEFSYGYAAIRHAEVDLFNMFGPGSFPFQPSLRAEATHGWDVRLAFPGFALLMQFKLSSFIGRPHPRSPTWGAVSTPHYRFAVDTRHHQFRALLALEQEMRRLRVPGDVLYAAPNFRTVNEFDEVYRSGAVLDESMLVAPSQFSGPIGWHHYTVDLYGHARILSEPTSVEVPIRWSDLRRRARRYLRRPFARREQDFYKLLDAVSTVSYEFGIPFSVDEEVNPLTELERFALLLGCSIVLPPSPFN